MKNYIYRLAKAVWLTERNSLLYNIDRLKQQVNEKDFKIKRLEYQIELYERTKHE